MRGKVRTNGWGRKGRLIVLVPLGIAVLGVLGLAGCVRDNATTSNAEVDLRITAINGNAPLTSDVASDDGTVTPDQVTVSIAVRHKNLRLEAPLIPQAVFLEQYEIRYIRSDGRGLEGEDVPYRITGLLTVVEDVRDTGGAEFELEVVRAQAKLEPPLMNLRGGGGALVLTVFAEVTIYGRTVSGQVVQDTGRLQIDFADWTG